MDMHEFSDKFVAATQKLSAQERQLLLQAFEKVAAELEQKPQGTAAEATVQAGVPDGMTERLKRLKANYMKQVPRITTYRAQAITKIAKENPGMPKIMLRAKCFRYCCETAPLVIQEDELIVGHPCGAPRAGAFSPDLAWRWMEEEIDTIGTRPQDPFYISEEDKRIMREELFPYWKGKSVDEYCEDQFREARFMGIIG